jgi:hypothetical protein
MKAAIEREGSSFAFAERCGVDRTYISHILRGRHPLGAPIIKGRGLRRVYVAAKEKQGMTKRRLLCPVGLGFRSGHTSRRERNPSGVVVHFGVLEPALVSGIVQS